MGGSDVDAQPSGQLGVTNPESGQVALLPFDVRLLRRASPSFTAALLLRLEAPHAARQRA